MRELHYIDGVLLVSDDICDAVFRYAVALAQSEDADLVRIPILWEGRREYANVVLGPASQMFCTPTNVELDGADIEDPELVVDLNRRIRRLGPSTASPDDGDLGLDPDHPELDL